MERPWSGPDASSIHAHDLNHRRHSTRCDVACGDARPRGSDAYVAPGAPGTPAAEYSLAVTRICAGALLFEDAHDMGTRSDALAIATAIRASTARRLARVTALSVPPELQHASSRWISSQRRLASLYARLWVRIYDTIDAARTPAQLATLPKRLQQARARARPLEARCRTPRAQAPRPRLHRRRLRSRPAARRSDSGEQALNRLSILLRREGVRKVSCRSVCRRAWASNGRRPRA